MGSFAFEKNVFGNGNGRRSGCPVPVGGVYGFGDGGNGAAKRRPADL